MLSQIDIKALPYVLFVCKSLKTLPPISAIYFCLDGFDNLIYIGETANLLHRWNLHIGQIRSM